MSATGSQVACDDVLARLARFAHTDAPNRGDFAYGGTSLGKDIAAVVEALRLADAAIDYDLGICTDHAGNRCVDWCKHCQRSEASIVAKARLSNAYREARGR